MIDLPVFHDVIDICDVPEGYELEQFLPVGVPRPEGVFPVYAWTNETQDTFIEFWGSDDSAYDQTYYRYTADSIRLCAASMDSSTLTGDCEAILQAHTSGRHFKTLEELKSAD